MVIVGFGVDNASGLPFWKVRMSEANINPYLSKVKNSWGELWGESGFLRIRRDGPTAHCGIGLTGVCLKQKFALLKSPIAKEWISQSIFNFTLSLRLCEDCDKTVS